MKKTKDVLEPKMNDIIIMLIDGYGYREIAQMVKIPLSTLHDFLNKPEHSARAREALEYSASSYSELAEQVLKDVRPDDTQVSMSRARELAQHYRWKASKRAPKIYGDKIGVDIDLSDNAVTLTKKIIGGKH